MVYMPWIQLLPGKHSNTGDFPLQRPNKQNIFFMFFFQCNFFFSYGIEIGICGAENYYKETETRARCLTLLSHHNLGIHFFQALKFYEDIKESTRLLNLGMEIHLVGEK